MNIGRSAGLALSIGAGVAGGLAIGGIVAGLNDESADAGALHTTAKMGGYGASALALAGGAAMGLGALAMRGGDPGSSVIGALLVSAGALGVVGGVSVGSGALTTEIMSRLQR